MKFTFIQLIPTLLMLSGLTGCALNQPQAAAPPVEETIEATEPTKPATFDRQAMLRRIVEGSIFPLHEQFVAETEALQQAVYDLRDDPTEETLAQAQNQWQTTAATWAQAEHLSLRFTMIVHNQIKKWPINVRFIEGFITEETDTIDEPFIESIGSTSKGLTAIEYLLFSPEMSETDTLQTLVDDPRRMAYLVALTENLQRKAEELRLLWAAEGDNQAQAFIEADFSANEVQGSISMLANEMIALVEGVANTKVDYPLSGTYAEPQPQAVESPYAGYSIPLAVANLRGLQQTLKAGFNDYLDFLGAEYQGQPLSAAIDAQIEQTIAALEAIEPPLSTAVLDNPDTVERAYDETKMLIVLLKTDMANQLGLTVTFSDNDGD